MRGSVVDLAVGVIIGAAFKSIVDSLVNDILSPLLGLIVNTNFSDLTLRIGDVPLSYGSFLTAILNFILMALILFLLVKGLNKLNSLTKKPEKAPEPTTKICPFCKSEVSLEATRCPHCTSDLEQH